MRQDLLHMKFIKAVQEQMMRFIMDEIINPMGEFQEDEKPISRPRHLS